MDRLRHARGWCVELGRTSNDPRAELTGRVLMACTGWTTESYGRDESGEGNRPDGEIPVHAVDLTAFSIDATPVTNQVFHTFVDAMGT
jgi:formylglycine-generating enzyme required for sulfatase activity